MYDKINKLADELQTQVYKDPLLGQVARENFLYGAAQQALIDKEQIAITEKEIIHKAYLWLLENCFVDMGSHDTDVHFRSGYIHDFLKDMEDKNWKSKSLDKEE